MTQIDGFDIPENFETNRSSLRLEKNGWEIEETSPPELNLVFDVWASILRPLIESLPFDYFTEKTANYLKRVTKDSSPLNLADAMLKRRFLRRVQLFSLRIIRKHPTLCISLEDRFRLNPKMVIDS